MNERGIRSMLAPLGRAISMMAGRAVVRLVNDETARQLLQVEILKGELRDKVEHVQNYGFTSHPFPGSDAIVLALGGSREQSVALIVDDRRYRLLLVQGEVAIYDDLGNFAALLRDRIHVKSITEILAEAPHVRTLATTATIDATTTNINSDVNVVGNTTFTGTVTANGKSIDDTHRHDGVEAGSDNSGTPI